MVALSQITPETTYTDIKGQVEANLKEGWGIPYECLILMARTLDKQTRALEQCIERLNDAKSRLPLEDPTNERRRLLQQKAADQSLTIMKRLIRRPRLLQEVMEKADASVDDVAAIFGLEGISTLSLE